MITLFPRPTPFFVLQFALTIRHGSGKNGKKVIKQGRSMIVNDVRWTRGEWT